MGSKPETPTELEPEKTSTMFSQFLNPFKSSNPDDERSGSVNDIGHESKTVSPPTGPQEDANQGKITKVLVRSIILSCLGNSFMYGWQLGVLNNTRNHVRTFINTTIFTRHGEGYSEKELLYYMDVVDAVFTAGGFFGSLLSGKVADKLGRKRGMIYITPLMLMAAILASMVKGFAGYPELLVASRFMSGVHSGISLAVNSIYINEIAPQKIRGSVVTVFQLCITLGILATYIVGLPDILGTEKWWPTLFTLMLGPSMASMLLLPVCPESPRYTMITMNDEETARKDLMSLRGTTDVEAEIRSMRHESLKSRGLSHYTFLDLLKEKSLRKGTLLACYLFIAQQYSGSNSVFAFSTRLYKQFVAENEVPYIIIIQGGVNTLATVLAIPLMEKLGRRKMLIYPTILVFVSLIVMTGLRYKIDTSGDDDDRLYGLISIIFTMTYIAAYALSLGPIPYVMGPEFFRQESRATAVSLSVACNWGSNFVIFMTHNIIESAIAYKVNFTYICGIFISIVVFWIWIPETKNKSYDEMATELAPRNYSVNKRDTSAHESLNAATSMSADLITN